MNDNMYNNNVNEQELLLRQKIEKREKIDVVLAYILIVILIGCIGIVLYLKFIRKEEVSVPEEYVPNYISLNEISSLLNSSLLANRYTNDGASFISNVSGNSIVVTYSKDGDIVNLNVPVVGSELKFAMDEDNSEIVSDVYREVANIVCVYYDNSEDSCRNVINNIDSSSSIDGIRYENNNTVYVNTTKSVDVNAQILSTTALKTSINSTDYEVTSSDISISGVNVINGENGITLNGNIERLNEDKFGFSVVIKLYDTLGNVLDENTLTYSEDDLVDGETTLTAGFVSDEYKTSDVSEYSIEIVK